MAKRPRKKHDDKVTCVRLPLTLLARLDALRAESGVTRTAIIRMATMQGLGEVERRLLK